MVLETSGGFKCRNKQEAIVRELIINPNTSYKKIAEMFGTTQAYVAFTVSLAKRLEVLDPKKRYGADVKLKTKTLERLKEELENE